MKKLYALLVVLCVGCDLVGLELVLEKERSGMILSLQNGQNDLMRAVDRGGSSTSKQELLSSAIEHELDAACTATWLCNLADTAAIPRKIYDESCGVLGMVGDLYVVVKRLILATNPNLAGGPRPLNADLMNLE